MNTFEEMYPSKSVGDGCGVFKQLFKTKSDDGGFVELFPVVSNVVEVDGDQLSTQYNDDCIVGGGRDSIDMSGEAGVVPLGEQSEDDLQVVWDEGYAAGATEAGTIAANKYAKQLVSVKGQHKSSIESVSFAVSEINLSDEIINRYKEYCDEVCRKVFGDAVSDELKGFIDAKVKTFVDEMRMNSPVIKIHVSQNNFDVLKTVCSPLSDGQLELSKGCSIQALSSMSDEDVCKVVVENAGDAIKADLNLSSTGDDAEMITSNILGDGVIPNHDDVQQMGAGGSDGSKSDILKMMSASLRDVDFDGIGTIDDVLTSSKEWNK